MKRPFRVGLWSWVLTGLLVLAGGGLCVLVQADQIILKGGTTFTGKVKSQEGGLVTFEVDGGGVMSLPESAIEKVEISEPESPGQDAEPTMAMVDIEILAPTETPTPTATPVPVVASDSGKEAGKALKDWSEAEIESLGKGRKRYGRTQDTVGVVEVKRPGGDWDELGTETFLFEGDEIRTQNGRTKIFLDEPTHETEIRLNEDSHLAVPKSEPVSTIDLLRGKMWSRIKSLSQADEVKFRVRTPNAVAGVRGTLLYVQILSKDDKVAVLEGEVDVQGRKEEENRQRIGKMKAVLVSQADEAFSSLLNVGVDEIKEWEEWDEWAKQTKASLAPYTAGVPGARGIVEGQIDQVAAEGKLYSQMVAEGNRLILNNRQSDQLDSLKAIVLRYYQDMGHLPPEDRGLHYLQDNLESSQQWKGPYLDVKTRLPVHDLWGEEVLYRIQTSEKSGRVYAELISGGPNKRLDDGQADDIRAVIIPE